MSCGGGFFTPGGAYDSVWDSVRPMTGNYTFSFQFQVNAGCVCMLNYWFSSNDVFFLRRQLQLPVQVEGKCRSEKWEVYLDRVHDLFHEDVGCVSLLTGWISCCDGFRRELAPRCSATQLGA